MGLAPDAWGPSVWASIHILCYAAPDELTPAHQQQYIAFFKALPYLLPCSSCSVHLLEHYQSLPVESSVSGRAALFAWSVQLHNAVNELLGKPQWTVEEAEAYWKKRLNTTGSTGFGNLRFHWGWMAVVWIGILTVFGIFGYQQWKKKAR